MNIKEYFYILQQPSMYRELLPNTKRLNKMETQNENEIRGKFADFVDEEIGLEESGEANY